MKTFKQYLQEALDKPYDYDDMGSYANSSGHSNHRYSFKDQKGVPTHVNISHYKAENGKLYANVDFTDEHGDTEATGKGGIRHFSTVKKILKDHAAKHPKLHTYEFSGVAERGRDALYSRLTAKYKGRKEGIDDNTNQYYIPISRRKKRG